MKPGITLAVLAAMAILHPCAEAKVLVVHYKVTTALGIGGSVESPPNSERQLKLLTALLDRTGADYKIVEYTGTQTEYFRTGVQVWNYGTKGAYTESFDGVIHSPFTGINAPISAGAFGRTGVGSRASPESMLVGGATKAPLVPQLMIITNENPVAYGDNLGLMDATACTTGVSTDVAQGGHVSYLAGNSAIRWFPGSYVGNFLLNSTRPAGGLRVLVGTGLSNYIKMVGTDGHESLWPDSINIPTTVDTVAAWERMFTHVDGAKPVVFVLTGTGGLPPDSSYDISGTDRSSAEGDVAMLMIGLARLDSLTNHGVWPGNKLPLKMGLTIDGGFSRNARLHPRGIFAADSAVAKATIDSLAALDIPFVVGVNIDSVQTYPSEKNWWASARKAKYTPQSWTGVEDSSGNSSRSSFNLPIDAYGRNRKRAAFGDTTTHAGADSTLYKLLAGGLYKCDSIFGRSRVSRFALPARDDWTPRGMNNSTSRPGIDSVLFAMKRAGFSGVRVNTNDMDCDVNYLRANPRGWINRQGWARTARGEQFKLLGYPGYPLGGGVKTYFALTDSTPPDAILLGKTSTEIDRAWRGFVYDSDRNADAFGYDDPYWAFTPNARDYDGVHTNKKDRVFALHYRGSLIRLSFNDLSGIPNGPPSRLGWITVKSIANAFKAINGLANRTVVQFAYPEDINP